MASVGGTKIVFLSFDRKCKLLDLSLRSLLSWTQKSLCMVMNVH
jgi:hypothetical protein